MNSDTEPDEDPSTEDLPPDLAQYQQSFEGVLEFWMTYLAEFGPERYQPRTIRDLRTWTWQPRPGVEQRPELLASQWFCARLPNSSTSRNRKRAAYALNRFFCDDMTPIGVEVPSQHAEDRHASDPSCMSCHYKLDPMAGFFRKHGAYLTAYSLVNTIYSALGVPQSAWRVLARGQPPAPILTGLLGGRGAFSARPS